jgi:glycosyltransferase involved in cell wall biosynthesis
VGAGSRTIVLAANDSWNLVNYRAGLIAALQDAGFRVAALAPPGPHADRFRNMGVEFHPVPMTPRGTSPLGDFRTLLGFRRQLKAIRPAALLGFTSKPNIYGSIAARMCGVPVIINNISGLGTAFSKAGPLQRLAAGLYRFALRRSSTVFFQNRDDLELFQSRRLVRPGQAALLPGSGVDLDRFSPRGPAPHRGPFVFLFAARLLWEKGISEFAEAARRLSGERGDVRFQILGFVEPPGDAAVPHSQLRAWEEEGIIDYLGSTDDVREPYSRADCVVLPSYYREGVPRVLLEASAMGLPVITTDMPGCRHAVDDGATGLLCEPRSIESLMAAMERMLQMPAEERRTMGLAGRTKMASEFDERLVHPAYLEALEKLGICAS